MADAASTVLRAFSKDGTPIAWRRSGQGAPLVLVHGTTADHTRWHPLLPRLEERFSVCAVDRRGRGASGDAPVYSIAREFEDIAAVVDAIGEPVFLLGHSYGALCSLEACLLTNGVRRLILYEPPVPIGIEIYPRPLVAHLEALLAKGERAEVVTTFFREVVRAPAAEIAMRQGLPNWPARVAAAHTILREMRLTEAYAFEPGRFAAMRTPTLMLLGGDSPPFLTRATEVVHQALPASRLVVMAGQQHAAMDTAPELFVAEVFAFLA